MFNLVKNEYPRYLTVPQFAQITGLTFGEYSSLHREGKIPMVRKNGESFVDLEALEALVEQQGNDEKSQ